MPCVISRGPFRVRYEFFCVSIPGGPGVEARSTGHSEELALGQDAVRPAAYDAGTSREGFPDFKGDRKKLRGSVPQSTAQMSSKYLVQRRAPQQLPVHAVEPLAALLIAVLLLRIVPQSTLQLPLEKLPPSQDAGCLWDFWKGFPYWLKAVRNVQEAIPDVCYETFCVSSSDAPGATVRSACTPRSPRGRSTGTPSFRGA